MEEHECIIGIALFDGDKRDITEKQMQFLEELNIDWRWYERFDYCPKCGGKINWQERNRTDISSHALE